jgi:hypothetical protein
MEFDSATPILTTVNDQNHIVTQTVFDHPILKHIFFVLFLNIAIIGFVHRIYWREKKSLIIFLNITIFDQSLQ